MIVIVTTTATSFIRSRACRQPNRTAAAPATGFLQTVSTPERLVRKPPIPRCR
jgi:hypothetical protein